MTARLGFPRDFIDSTLGFVYAPDARPPTGPASTQATKPFALACTPCSTTSARLRSQPPHKQHLAEQRMQAS